MNTAMFSPRWLKILVPLMLSMTLVVTACGGSSTKTPDPYKSVQKESSQKKSGQAVAKQAVEGKNFNKFFPSAGDGYKTIPSQEKKGFAEYKLNKGTKTVAMFSINDTVSTPDAAAKFKGSTKKIGGYPAVETGSTATSVLVADRFQAKVLTRDASFTKSDREAWLKKFNLSGLANVK
jgi:cytochrome c5